MNHWRWSELIFIGSDYADQKQGRAEYKFVCIFAACIEYSQSRGPQPLVCGPVPGRGALPIGPCRHLCSFPWLARQARLYLPSSPCSQSELRKCSPAAKLHLCSLPWLQDELLRHSSMPGCACAVHPTAKANCAGASCLGQGKFFFPWCRNVVPTGLRTSDRENIWGDPFHSLVNGDFFQMAFFPKSDHPNEWEPMCSHPDLQSSHMDLTNFCRQQRGMNSSCHILPQLLMLNFKHLLQDWGKALLFRTGRQWNCWPNDRVLIHSPPTS